MKIALVWNDPKPIDRLSFRFGLYADGFRQLGHEAVVVCRRAAAGEVDPSMVLAESAAQLEESAFWQQLGADVAFAITYHRKSAMLRAIRQAGTRTLALSDSDGQVGLRAHPRITWQRIWHYLPDLPNRLRAIKYFAGRYLLDRWRGQPEDAEYLESTRQSDAVVFHSQPAIDSFRHFLRSHGAEHLKAKLRVVPFAVPESFQQIALPETKDDLILAVGRWSDPQKDAPLLVAALARLSQQRPQTRVEIFGHDAEGPFGEAARRFSNWRLRGAVPLEFIQETLARARCVVFASRWETGPHVATEALSLGATLVGAPIPNLLGLTADGRFGTVAKDRRPSSLAAALVTELEAWDSGQRDGLDIANHWRPQLTPVSVCEQLLAALDSTSPRS